MLNMDNRFLVGALDCDITPPIGLPMDGYMARVGVNRGTHDPLLAQVLVLEDTHLRAALVTLDVLGVSAAFTDRLRSSLAAVLHTGPDAIMICASHTHAGPSGLQNRLSEGESTLNSPLMDLIEARLTNAASSALNRLAPARLIFGTGPIDGIGTDRNRLLPAPDPVVTALHFEHLDGTPFAIVFHYACHPTVLSPQLEYSADFPGAARRRIRARFPNTICLYLNGAAGNISTRFTRRSQTFDEVDRLGNLLGDHVLALLENPESCSTDLATASKPVDLPLRKLPAQATYAFQPSGNPRIDQTRAEGAVIEANMKRAFANRKSVTITLPVLQIGPWKLLGVPGEPFNELAAELREISPWAVVVGYANDYLGYFPTQQAIDDATYEALSSPFDARALDTIRNVLAALL
jgi:hypothetical protein